MIRWSMLIRIIIEGYIDNTIEALNDITGNSKHEQIDNKSVIRFIGSLQLTLNIVFPIVATVQMYRHKAHLAHEHVTKKYSSLF